MMIFVSTTLVALWLVSANRRPSISESGTLENSSTDWTSPSALIDRFGRMTVSALWRAYSIDEIGVMSRAPCTNSWLSSAGGPFFTATGRSMTPCSMP